MGVDLHMSSCVFPATKRICKNAHDKPGLVVASGLDTYAESYYSAYSALSSIIYSYTSYNTALRKQGCRGENSERHPRQLTQVVGGSADSSVHRDVSTLNHYHPSQHEYRVPATPLGSTWRIFMMLS